MIDRTIPFYNTILRCDRYRPQAINLPDKFEIVNYHAGYEKAWAKLEYDIGDFDSIEVAEKYFVPTYLKNESQLANILFLLNPEKQEIGSCIAWQDARGDSTVASLHQLVIEESFQGQGLGRALCTVVMNRFAKQGRLPEYIHTQPWSWKAILTYISIGFKIQKIDTFSHYENQFDLAIETLKGIVFEKQFDVIKASSEQQYKF